MISRQDDFLCVEQRDPALCFESLACFVDDHDIEVCMTKLVPACAVEGRKYDFTASDKLIDTFPFPYAIVFSQVLHIGIDGFPLPSAFRLSDACLLCVKLVSDIFHYGCSVGGAYQDVEGVVENTG